MNRYFILFKPYKMVSQFISPYKQSKLCDLDFEFPEGTNAVGRLDNESEGLLILTTDKLLSKKLLHPTKKHLRHYVVQVEKLVGEEALNTLRTGVEILIKGQNRVYKTQACRVNIISRPHFLRDELHELNNNYPNTWLEFILMEGKNRQIRKMCKAVRHKCRRLVRTKIEDLEVGDLQPGEVKEIEQEKLFTLLKLN